MKRRPSSTTLFPYTTLFRSPVMIGSGAVGTITIGIGRTNATGDARIISCRQAPTTWYGTEARDLRGPLNLTPGCADSSLERRKGGEHRHGSSVARQGWTVVQEFPAHAIS